MDAKTPVIIGYWNATGYRVCELASGRVIVEHCIAGNHKQDPTVVTTEPASMLDPKIIQRMCMRTAREKADALNLPLAGIEYEEMEGM